MLMIFTEVMNYLQTSPSSVSYFFYCVFEVQQIHTHKGLPVSLCSFIKPVMENPHLFQPHYIIKKMLLKVSVP
jgi:hypothetical protein